MKEQNTYNPVEAGDGREGCCKGHCDKKGNSPDEEASPKVWIAFGVPIIVFVILMAVGAWCLEGFIDSEIVRMAVSIPAAAVVSLVVMWVFKNSGAVYGDTGYDR